MSGEGRERFVAGAKSPGSSEAFRYLRQRSLSPHIERGDTGGEAAERIGVDPIRAGRRGGVLEPLHGEARIQQVGARRREFVFLTLAVEARLHVDTVRNRVAERQRDRSRGRRNQLEPALATVPGRLEERE